MGNIGLSDNLAGYKIPIGEQEISQHKLNQSSVIMKNMLVLFNDDVPG